MFTRILLALDGSEHAERALPWLKRLGGPRKAGVVLFRAVDLRRPRRDRLDHERREARDYLFRLEKELNYAGLPAKVVVGEGRAAEAIVRAAVDERCDLILMTTRGGSPVKRRIGGGVTEQVLRTSPVPVLPVRGPVALPKQGRVRRVIVSVDGSKVAESAIPWAGRLSKFLKTRLVFLHIVPPGRGHRRAEPIRLRMEALVGRLNTEGVKATFAVRGGDAAAGVLAFADRDDLIVTTTRGSGRFKRWIFGSVAETLIHESRIPVLVFKTPAKRTAAAG